jgi:hypothetical protein
MITEKYGAGIGKKEPITWTFTPGTRKISSFPASHSAVVPIDHETTEFRQTTV